MISEVVAALQESTAAHARNDAPGYAFHTGQAGGIAAALGLFGIKGLSLCDDISDAYETGDSGFMASILSEASERLENPASGARVMDSDAIGWPEYGAALNQAAEAQAAGDHMRYALMAGFVAGLMFNNPGPDYPDHGTIRDAVLKAYAAGSDKTLKWAQARIGAGLRMTDPTPFMGQEQYGRHYEERLRMMRWAQNFGLRQARAGEQGVAVPGSMRINHAVRQQTQPNRDNGVGDGETSDVHTAATRASHNAEYYISQGYSKRNSGDCDGAIADFDRAIELDPNNANAFCGRGDAKRGKGDYDGAIADCDRAIAIDPTYPGGCNIRGMSRWEKGDHDGAIADFDRAVELDPDHAGAYYIRGMIKEEKKDYMGAIADFDRAIALEPDDADMYNHRGYSKLVLKDYDGAISDFDRVLELEPGNEYAQQTRNSAASRGGDCG